MIIKYALKNVDEGEYLKSYYRAYDLEYTSKIHKAIEYESEEEAIRSAHDLCIEVFTIEKWYQLEEELDDD